MRQEAQGEEGLGASGDCAIMAVALVACMALVGQLMRRVLFGVKPLDPLTFCTVAFLTTFLALTAAWIPTPLAAGVDPIEPLLMECTLSRSSGTGSIHSEPLPNRYRLIDFERGSFGHLGFELLGESRHVVGEDGRLTAGAGDGDVAEAGTEQVGWTLVSAWMRTRSG